jgi:protein involved in polysaccharide export with SLBB domain
MRLARFDGLAVNPVAWSAIKAAIVGKVKVPGV